MKENLKELYTKIQENLAQNPEKRFAVFDFDNTCILNDSGEAVLAHLCRNLLLRDPFLLEEDSELNEEYHKKVFETYHGFSNKNEIINAYFLCAKVFSGFSPEEVRDITKQVIQSEGNQLGTQECYGMTIPHGITLQTQVIELIDFLKKEGVAVWIISASQQVSVKTTMDHFGLSAQLIGINNEIKDGKFTRTILEPTPVVKGKVLCMRTIIDSASNPIIVVDDSTTGLPILTTADIPVVVGQNNALIKIAEEKAWFMI